MIHEEPYYRFKRNTVGREMDVFQLTHRQAIFQKISPDMEMGSRMVVRGITDVLVPENPVFAHWPVVELVLVLGLRYLEIAGLFVHKNLHEEPEVIAIREWEGSFRGFPPAKDGDFCILARKKPDVSRILEDCATQEELNEIPE
ncbi:MAG: hypothetical protein HY717_01655 [Planctomycetes bacterium]|nr:hypothetical protein [Planctomycetota bacterium]